MIISRKCFSQAWSSSLELWPLRCTECLYKWKFGWQEWKPAIRHQDDRNAPQHGETRHLSSAACFCWWQSKDPWTKHACFGRLRFSPPFLQRKPRPGNLRSLKDHKKCITFGSLSWTDPKLFGVIGSSKGHCAASWEHRSRWTSERFPNVFRIFQVLAACMWVSHALSRSPTVDSVSFPCLRRVFFLLLLGF